VALTITMDELPDVWVLTAGGDLDYAECSAFRLKIDRVLLAMPPALVVDFSHVDYLDSSGLGLLLSLTREYETGGGRLFLVTDETVDGVLAITRLAGVFTIEADVESALARLDGPAAPEAGAAGV
jgi:anti-sigma B factor antagonist